MSFKTNDYQQLTLNDSFLQSSKRVQKMIEKSWAKDFADIVFPAINEERFAVLYSDNPFSRPNTPVNVIVGALMLKELNNLSDDELLASILCDVRYQYALHTTSYDEQPVSDRTFSRFREKLEAYEKETNVDLISAEMKGLSNEYADFMNLRKDIKRMDSLMIASRCKSMSRLQIVYKTVSNALKLLHRLGLDEIIPSSLLHYLDPEDENQVIYHCKGDESISSLDKAIADALAVKQLMSSEEWPEFQEYQLLIRVLKEQSVPSVEKNIEAKPSSMVKPDSLQNPSDPDATYREKAGKKNKGYVGNIVETVGEDGDGIISDFSFEQNTYSDIDFCKDYLNSRPEDADHETVITDGGFGSEENRELANDKNVELITTALTGAIPDTVFAEFEMSADGTRVTKCPAGHEPLGTTFHAKTGTCRARFSKEACCNCPYRDKCKPKEQKKNYAVNVSAKKVARASYLNKLSTDEYRKLTKLRNAIEGIPSVLRRKYRIDEMPVYGYIRSKMLYALKIGAYNIQKLGRYCKRQRGESASLSTIS